MAKTALDSGILNYDGLDEVPGNNVALKGISIDQYMPKPIVRGIAQEDLRQFTELEMAD